MTERDGASTAAMSRPSTTDPDSDLADPLQDQFDEPDLADFGDLVELDDPDHPTAKVPDPTPVDCRSDRRTR